MNSDRVDVQGEKYVTANGLNIHYAEYGTGAPLILLHGGTANLQSWDGHIPAFSQHFRVIAVDSRAHGKTNNPTGELSYRLMADDLAAFIQALNLTKPLLFGYSDGGQIALEFGMRYPSLAGALVLGGTVYKFTDRYYETLRGMGFEQPGQVNVDNMRTSDPGWVEYLETAHPCADDPDYWKTLIKQISVMWLTPLGYTTDDLQKINIPTLILVGDRDEGVGVEQAVEMYRGIPKAELMIMPNADHGSGYSELSNSMVMTFLSRHAAKMD